MKPQNKLLEIIIPIIGVIASIGFIVQIVMAFIDK
jgi:hypothetical protein